MAKIKPASADGATPGTSGIAVPSASQPVPATTPAVPQARPVNDAHVDAVSSGPKIIKLRMETSLKSQTLVVLPWTQKSLKNFLFLTSCSFIFCAFISLFQYFWMDVDSI
jgi:hypothetical protein